mmetsp:Transcript_3205/g.7010  ORF Transcript_3205/g.7010 Transcript_3205/m.7010 type:complete len:366 (+) Transcript_3205:30-1127(+)
MAKKNKSTSSKGGKTGGSGGSKRSAAAGAKNQHGNSSSSTSSTSSTPLLSSGLAVLVGIAIAGGRMLLSPADGSTGSSTSLLSFKGSQTTLDSDPWVDIIPRVIPPDTCNAIIYKSEQIRYRLMDDTIDSGDPSNYDQQTQEVYIYHNERVIEPTLYELIEPHLPTLTDAIKRRRERVWGSEFADGASFTDPTYEWIFLRKYYPLGRYSKRNSLKVHTDSNMHSITLALNDNYLGGGLFVVRTRTDENATQAVGSSSSSSTSSSNDRSSNDRNGVNLHLPEIPHEYGSYKYLHEHDGLVRRQNSSDVFFPELKQGSAALINFTVPHGVAPLAEGSQFPRYALIVFYNIDSYYETVHPLIEELQRP